MDADAEPALEEAKEPEEVEIHKKPRKKRKKSIFVDQECSESKSRGASKKRTKGPVKTKAREKKKMESAQTELAALLTLLHDNTACNEHYVFPDDTLQRRFAQAWKWAHTIDCEDDGTHGEEGHECRGMLVVWEWMSANMQNYESKVLKRRLGDMLVGKEDEMQELKMEAKTEWAAIFKNATPLAGAVNIVRSWVKHSVEKKGVSLNPGITDMELSGLAVRYLKETFIVIDENGTSVVWEPEVRLWVQRKKDRSSVALGASLYGLLNKKIIFTDPELSEKFGKKVRSAGTTVSILGWLKGQTPVFPHPIKDKLDRDTWTIAIQGGMLADMEKLEIRKRKSTDLFTMTTNFSWLPLPQDRVDEYKKAVQNDSKEKPEDILKELCPNAWKFTQGPFRDSERHLSMLLRFGTFLSSHCTRKGIWIYGDGKGMKSTLMNAFINAMGPFAILLAKKVFFLNGMGESGHNTDLMRAEGKRLVVVDELERRDQLRETLYKQFIAHGTISAREIFGGQGEWKPMATAVFVTNTVVSLSFTDSAISDRILPVRGTTRVFNPEDEAQKLPPGYKAEEWKEGYDNTGETYWVMKDPEKEQEAAKFLLAEEDGGYRNELGCFMILCAHMAHVFLGEKENRGELPLHPVFQKDYRQFIQEADHIGQYLHENCHANMGMETGLKAVFKDYKDSWCVEQGIKPIEQKLFRASLNQKGLLFKGKTKFFDPRSNALQTGGALVYMVRVALKTDLNFEVNMDAFSE